MKKIIIAMAIVASAMVVNAAAFNWTTSAAASSVVSEDILGNGSYGISTAAADRMNKAGSWTYVLTLYSGDTLVGSTSGDVKFNALSGKVATAITIDAAAASTAYSYVLTITGTDTGLTGRGSVTEGTTIYDYTGATLSTEFKGTITTAGTGNTTLTTAAPSEWVVSGITTTSVPEPTSGLLLLMGLAGLALRRKQA